MSLLNHRISLPPPPPMHAWPRPVKLAILGLVALVCIGVYAGMFAALASLFSLLLTIS